MATVLRVTNSNWYGRPDYNTTMDDFIGAVRVAQLLTFGHSHLCQTQHFLRRTMAEILITTSILAVVI